MYLDVAVDTLNRATVRRVPGCCTCCNWVSIGLISVPGRVPLTTDDTRAHSPHIMHLSVLAPECLLSAENVMGLIFHSFAEDRIFVQVNSYITLQDVDARASDHVQLFSEVCRAGTRWLAHQIPL